MAARCRYSIPNMKTMAWRAPFGKLAGGDDSHLCQQPICSCLRGRIRPQKKHKSEDAGLKDTFVFTIQAANLSFQSPHSAAKRRNLRAADHGRRWYVFLGLRQGWTKYLARSGIIKRWRKNSANFDLSGTPMAAHSACNNCSGPKSDLERRLLFPAKLSSRSITFSSNK